MAYAVIEVRRAAAKVSLLSGCVGAENRQISSKYNQINALHCLKKFGPVNEALARIMSSIIFWKSVHMSKRQLKAAHTALRQANSYSEWLNAAKTADQLSGAEQWRADEKSPFIDAQQMREQIAQLNTAIENKNVEKLRALIYDSLYRHMGDIANPQLYSYAFAGTKHIVEDYLQAVEDGVRAIAELPSAIMSEADKHSALKAAAFNLGRPALLLSGGASMGFVHLGVAKALHEHNLLPDVISGSSLGSLVAAGIGSRTPEGLKQLLSHTDEIYRFGIQFLSPAHIVSRGSVLDGHQMLRCAYKNVGDLTFAEAYARSGINLGISVSPSRSRQKPRLLSHISSPDVLLPRAALASCSIPGLFPAVKLKARNAQGRYAYLPQDKWVDGSFQADLPMKRLGRLFNVNQFIVSQANPHSVPFLASRHGRGVSSWIIDAGLSSARAQFGAMLKVARERVLQPRLHNVVEHAYAITEQSYRGDINIHPPVSRWLYERLLSNPSPQDMLRYTKIGEQATWPKLMMINNVTRISRLVHSLLKN